MHKTNGNFGLGLIALIVGVIWLLKDINIIPDWFPAWSGFLILLGIVLLWSGVKR